MEVKIYSEWSEELPPAMWPAYGYLCKVIAEMPKPVVTKKELEFYSGMPATKAIEKLGHCVSFAIKTHTDYIIALVNNNLLRVDKDVDMGKLLGWLGEQPEFLAPTTNKEQIALEQVLYEMLNGVFLQTHRWANSTAYSLPKQVSDTLEGCKRVGRNVLTDIFSKALSNFRYGVSLGYQSPVFRWKGGKLRMKAGDFFCNEYSSGHCDSIFLDFLTNNSYWRIPECWSEIVFKNINQTNYAALLEAGAFCSLLESRWELLLEMNKKFITQKKGMVLELITWEILSSGIPRIAQYPFPDPNTAHYATLQKHLAGKGTFLPEAI